MKGDVNGGPVRWRMHLPVPPEKVFEALNSDRGRASFWAESAIEVEGQIEFQFANGFAHKSRILERRAPEVFMVDYFGGPARFELKSDGAGGTDLLLIHDFASEDEWNEVHAGWLNVLFPMKAWIVHGVDLRNHDPGRTWDHGYADQ